MIGAMANLSPSDPRPDSTLVGPEGPTKLRDRIGKPLVVSTSRTRPTAARRRRAASAISTKGFVAAGAEVIGVSRDDTASHAKFREHHRPPFTLLSDPDGKIADLTKKYR
jgi:peroxiredoxin Q/BCP